MHLIKKYANRKMYDTTDKSYISRDMRDEKPEGSGLGLAICHRIINYHGGNIWVENTPDSGANFIFELSLVESSESPG